MKATSRRCCSTPARVKTGTRLVALAVSKNCGGIECLSGIPGTVGGTPVQNVGAYGQEVSETITHVRALEIATGKVLDLSNSDCGFSYRSSIFNGTRRNEFIVLQVSYRLCRNAEPKIEYADVKNFFAANKVEKPTLQQVRDAVRSIRQSKAMLLVEGDEDCRSAGSFFKNPIVSATEADTHRGCRPEARPSRTPAPLSFSRWQSKDSRQHGWWSRLDFTKATLVGPVGISRKHSLAIVNRGGATAKDILALKDEIEKKVFDVWGVRLQPEPVFVGF